MKEVKNTSDLVKMALFVAIIILLSVTPLGYIHLGVINATTIQIRSSSAQFSSAGKKAHSSAACSA